MANRQHGYSGKPIFQKLGLKPGMSCLVAGAPDHFAALMAGADGVRFEHGEPAGVSAGAYDAVHVFCRTRQSLHERRDAAIAALAEGGMLWISWPKKSSPLYVDLSENVVRDIVLPTGWVDVKVCAVDGDWSGLKFLKRRPKRTASAAP